MNLIRHNDYGKTLYNRHPIIFAAAKDQLVEPRRIMSFGCSVGCECITLTKMFPESEIFGVEIDGARRLEAMRVHSHPKISYSHVPMGDNYDAIFCMSVLCKHPETDEVEDCSEIYPFENFVSETGNLVKRLRVNGVMAFFNTTYFFADTKWAKSFEALDIESASEENVVKFESDGKRTTRSSKEYIFKKRA